MASPPPSPLPLRVEGEPGWGDYSGIHDRILDDVSDPIQVDSEASEDDDPSETSPVFGPSDDLLLKTMIPCSASSPRLLGNSTGDSLVGHPGAVSPLPWWFSATVGSPNLVKAISEGFLHLALSPIFDVSPAVPVDLLCGAPGHQAATVSEFSFLNTLPLSSSAPSSPPVGVTSTTAVIDMSSAEEVSVPAYQHLHPSSTASSSISHSSRARPSRPKAVLGVKTAAAKLLSKKRASSLLPLHSVSESDLLAWGRLSGFHVSGDSGDSFVASIRALEDSKAAMLPGN